MLGEDLLFILKKILGNYLEAKNKTFSKHPLAHFIRVDTVALLNPYLDSARFIVKASSGQGQWTTVPWIAVLDTLITTTPQNGYYIVYLFNADFSGVHLTLSQGVTSAQKNTTGLKGTIHNLTEQANVFRNKYLPSYFPFGEKINLHLPIDNKSNLATLYEYSPIYSIYYDATNLPTAKKLESDFKDFLALYSQLISFESMREDEYSILTEDVDNYTEYPKLYRTHKRIERNQTLIKKVKKLQGYTCTACGFNFLERYGDLGHEYIEAHHLQPLARLDVDKIELNPMKDFIVLCSNCHRMLHRTADPSDIEFFKKLLIQKN